MVGAGRGRSRPFDVLAGDENRRKAKLEGSREREFDVSRNPVVEWGPLVLPFSSVNGEVPQRFIPNGLTATSRIQGIDVFFVLHPSTPKES